MEENLEYCTVPIHFDNFQGEHKINSNSLSVFVDGYKEISKIFGLELEIQIEVPTEGGWKSNLLFTMIGFSLFF